MLVASPMLRLWTDHSQDSAGSSVPRRRPIARIGPNNNDLGDVAGNCRTRLGDGTRCDYSYELRHGVRRLGAVSGATGPIPTATRRNGIREALEGGGRWATAKRVVLGPLRD